MKRKTDTQSSDRKIIYIDFREYYNYPDAKLEDILQKKGIPDGAKYDVVYNQSLKRIEVYLRD